MAGTDNPTIGCCGIDCGLCPRYYTDGSSRCPGCGGEHFEEKHPACGFLTCCVKQRGLAVCGQCPEYPCKRFEKETGAHDSFVLHRCVIPNQALIRDKGMEAFLSHQAERMAFLKSALEQHNDGRSKKFFCIAAALLSLESLKEALRRAGEGENLKALLSSFAEAEGQDLRLRK